jgi:transcriptional regulator with XRE-family HTH domain
MIISARIKKIRELSGLRQSEVAGRLNITQQAYCGLEQSANNAKLETLKRFCKVMQIDLAYLVTDTIPVTEETLNRYGRREYVDILLELERAEKKLEILQGADTMKNSATVATYKSGDY